MIFSQRHDFKFKNKPDSINKWKEFRNKSWRIKPRNALLTICYESLYSWKINEKQMIIIETLRLWNRKGIASLLSYSFVFSYCWSYTFIPKGITRNSNRSFPCYFNKSDSSSSSQMVFWLNKYAPSSEFIKFLRFRLFRFFLVFANVWYPSLLNLLRLRPSFRRFGQSHWVLNTHQSTLILNWALPIHIVYIQVTFAAPPGDNNLLFFSNL